MATKKPKAKPAKRNAKASKPVKKIAKAAAKKSAKPAARKVTAGHSPLALRVAAMLGVGAKEAIERAVHELAERLGLHNVGGAQSHAQGGPAHAAADSHKADEAPAARPASSNAAGTRPAKSSDEGSKLTSEGTTIPRHALDLTPLPTRTVSASSPTLQHSPSSLPQRLYIALDGRGLDGSGMPLEVVNLPCTIGSSRRNTIWINSPRIETHHAQIVETDEGWVYEDLGSEHGTVFDGEKIERRVLRNGDTFLLAGYLRMKAELR